MTTLAITLLVGAGLLIVGLLVAIWSAEKDNAEPLDNVRRIEAELRRAGLR